MFKSFLAALLLTAASTGVVHAFAPCASGMSEISVEGINGIFCVSGSTICAAQTSQGACPGVQDGLAYGSYCGKVFSGVYGCKVLDSESVKTFQPWVDPKSTPVPTITAPTSAPAPTTPAPTTPAPTTPAPTTPAPTTPAPTTPVPTPSSSSPAPSSPAPSTNSCANGGSPVSVEGAQGVFCVTGTNICAADLGTGVCPAAQSGLPYGSYCGKVASGVYGCKVLTDSAGGQSSTTNSGTNDTSATSGSITATSSSSGTADTGSTATSTGTNDSTIAITSMTSTSTTPSMAPGSSTPAPSASTTTTTASSADCPNGGSPMSIEGVQKIFCVSGVACAADIATGNCPGKQGGLPFGSFCDKVRTGVYGCRPYVDDNNKKPSSTIAPPHSCAGSPAGNTPVSIVGALRDFCAQEPVCSGNRYGNCPGIQDGLDQESACAVLPNGVHGCVFFK